MDMEQLSLFDTEAVYDPLGKPGCVRRIWMSLQARRIFWERGSFCASSLSRTASRL